jgi:molybdopterin converting factor small subunit
MTLLRNGWWKAGACGSSKLGIQNLKLKMKSAYELAMERLNKTAPPAKLTGAQKKELAELDSKYAAKIAEREIALKDEMVKAAGDFEKVEALRQQLANERKRIQADLEEKKNAVRRAAGR